MGEFLVHNVRFFEFEAKAIHRLAYNELNCKLALSREDNSIEIWDLKKCPYQEKVIPGLRHRSVEALLWYRERLFSTGLDGDLTEYDLFKLTSKSTQETSETCWCMKLGHSTDQIAIGTDNGRVYLYAVTEDGAVFERLMGQQKGRIICLSWSHDNKYIASGSEDMITVWNVETGRVEHHIPLERADPVRSTVVWCIEFTSDSQIITGDSSGNLSVWDANRGIWIQSIKTHRADILALCLDKSENCIYASGVDPLTCRIERVWKNSANETKHWVKSAVRTPHTHDVRALALAGEHLISGGVDTYLVQMKFGPNIRTLTPPIPQSSLVSVLPKLNLVLFRYPQSLELWKLGSPAKDCGEPDEVLPLSSNVSKLIELKAKPKETITCCTISVNARYLAYSTNASFRLFELKNVEDLDEGKTPSLSRVSFSLPGSQVCHQMIFMPRPNTREMSKLALVKDDGTIQLIGVNAAPQLLGTLVPSNMEDTIHLIAASADGKYLATADHQSNVNVFEITSANIKLHCTLPKQRTQPTALAFHPNTCDLSLVVIYSDKQLIEFSVRERELTPWSRTVQQLHPLPWHGKHSVLGVTFDPRDDNLMIAYDSYQIAIINKNELFELASQTNETNNYNGHNHFINERNRDQWARKRKDNMSEKPYGIHQCHKYKHIVHVGVLAEGRWVVTEVNQLRLMKNLPKAFHKKKFGT